VHGSPEPNVVQGARKNSREHRVKIKKAGFEREKVT
jgi:hypothetical protein